MPNIISAPRFWKNKIILAKSEDTPGTDAAPTGAANWIEARNVSLTPLDAETVDRNIEMPWMGSSGKVQIAQYAKVSFEVLLAGSGAAGTAPKIAPVLLACGLAETLTPGTSAAYNLVSSAFGACSLYVNVDGTVHKLVGSRGNWSVSLAKGGFPLLKFEMDAVFTGPAAQAMPIIDRTGWPAEEAFNPTNTTALTLNALGFAFSALDLSAGNKLARINLPGPQVEIAITDRSPTGSATVLAPALAGFDPFALAKSGQVVTLSVTHGSAVGKKVRVDAKASIAGVDYDNIEGELAYKFTLAPTPVAGNDELVLTFM